MPDSLNQNLRRLAANGHVFHLDSRGVMDWWEEGHHDGYSCVLCHQDFCRNCDPDWGTEECPVAAQQPTLLGLDYPAGAFSS